MTWWFAWRPRVVSTVTMPNAGIVSLMGLERWSGFNFVNADAVVMDPVGLDDNTTVPGCFDEPSPAKAPAAMSSAATAKSHHPR
jgi:hypothetical protein